MDDNEDYGPSEAELADSEATIESELKRENAQLRRRIDDLMREKAEVIELARSLKRQINKIRSGKGV